MTEELDASRRRVPRKKYEKKIGLLYRGGYHITRAFEIGERGMLLSSDRKMYEGHCVVITFQVPGHSQAVVRAVIRYRKGEYVEGESNLYGVEFQNVNFEVKRQIRHFVASTAALNKKAS